MQVQPCGQVGSFIAARCEAVWQSSLGCSVASMLTARELNGTRCSATSWTLFFGWPAPSMLAICSHCFASASLQVLCALKVLSDEFTRRVSSLSSVGAPKCMLRLNSTVSLRAEPEKLLLSPWLRPLIVQFFQLQFAFLFHLRLDHVLLPQLSG